MKFLLSSEEKKIFLIPFSFFLVIIFTEIIGILLLNSGLMVYTTDDAYIHLALAENILNGHYGVNPNENSSPSSSILWPIILAPFAGFSFGYLLPLFINILSSVGSIIIFFLLLKRIFLSESHNTDLFNKITLLWMILLIIGTNLTGSLFSGMEHSLQIFLTTIAVLGLVTFLNEKNIPGWLIPVLIIAPLIRFENLALSFVSLMLIFFFGYRSKAVTAAIIIIFLIGGFSVFLLSLGLKPLPLSVLQKSSVISDGGLYPILLNFKENIVSPRGALLLAGVFFLLYMAFAGKKNKEEKLLAACFALAVLAHLVIGKDGRYIVYIWAASVFVFLFLCKETLVRVINKLGFLKIAVLSVSVTIFTSYYYILSILTIPVGSNNIYEQQYQMHRFAVEYYRKPVAVNDLGYVSYRNDDYVLDLVGLASIESLNYQHTSKTSEWMDTLCRKHGAELAMIYDDWFSTIPGNWYKSAELHLGKIKMSASRDKVSFYLLNTTRKKELAGLLKKFKETLPEGVILKINNEFNPE